MEGEGGCIHAISGVCRRDVFCSYISDTLAVTIMITNTGSESSQTPPQSSQQKQSAELSRSQRAPCVDSYNANKKKVSEDRDDGEEQER